MLQSLVQSKPGEPLSEEKIGADLRRIYGHGDFESVDYRIAQEPGRRVMMIEPKEKSWGPDYLRFGAGIATDFSGDASFNLLAQYRRTWLNRLGGEWLTELQVGRDNRLFTEFYQPIDERGRYFVAPYGSIGLSTRGIYQGEKRVAEYELRESRAGLDLGAALGTWGEVRAGPVVPPHQRPGGHRLSDPAGAHRNFGRPQHPRARRSDGPRVVPAQRLSRRRQRVPRRQVLRLDQQVRARSRALSTGLRASAPIPSTCAPRAAATCTRTCRCTRTSSSAVR